MTSLAKVAYIYRDMPVNSSSGVGVWLLALEPETGEPTIVIMPTRDRHHDPVPEADERLADVSPRSVATSSNPEEDSAEYGTQERMESAVASPMPT